MNNIDTITIVGGGTAGLCSALILKKRFPYKKITIIKSDKIGIIGVGEGSTEHWREFMNFCSISPKEIIKECDATLKLGVMFEGWTEKPYFHSVTSLLFHSRFGQYQAGYGCNVSAGNDQLESADQFYKTNELPLSQLDENNFETNQFHFNTFKLNEFLTKKCIERDIEIITDEILDVEVKDGNINRIYGEKNKYISDFFIDCTGFKRILIKKLGAKWESYNQYLKLNEAIAFQTEDTDNYNLYTLSKAMKCGWMWRIPVYGRWGNGYIFDNTIITADEAKAEVEQALGREIEVARNIKFDPGCVDKAWIGNCVAIGLSANFIEPLEATSIGTSLNQVFLLNHLLENYEQIDIDDYNRKVKEIMLNIRDFVFVHYMIDRTDTDFWTKISKLDPPETLRENLKRWKHRLPIKEDFTSTQYFLFFEQNWASVLYGLNLFDKNLIKKEYQSFDKEWHQYIDREIDFFNQRYNEARITHKEFLKYYRSN